jgi:hypothetical protein
MFEINRGRSLGAVHRRQFRDQLGQVQAVDVTFEPGGQLGRIVRDFEGM